MSNSEVLFIGLPIGLAVGFMLRHFFLKKFTIANRLGTLIKEEKYKEAILLGQSIDVATLEPIGKMNLGAAYYFSGDKKKAKEIINTITIPFGYKSSFKEALAEWKKKVNEG